MGWTATIACFLLAAGCASRGGWMEGDEVNGEVRRVLASDPCEGIGVETPKTAFHLGFGLRAERGALLAALARAEAIPAGPRDMQAVLEALDPLQPAGPRPRATAPPETSWIRIRYPDCLCSVRRITCEGDALGYRVDLDDRRFGNDRSLSYRMRLVPSPALDEAWEALLAAAHLREVCRALEGA